MNQLFGLQHRNGVGSAVHFFAFIFLRLFHHVAFVK